MTSFIDQKYGLSYALSWKPCQGDSLNLPDHRIHKDGDGDASFQLKSDSLPHAHAQSTKTFYKHQDSRIMKAQELKTKTSAQTLIYKIFLQRYQVYQGRLLASFQDDAKTLIIIDAAHLKGTYQGTNLIAVGMDGNNQIIPIATGVSQGETDKSWTWFLSKLKDCIGEVPNLAIISDRHYAIILACKTVFPNLFHGFCCRYLMMNCGMQSERPDAHHKLVEAGIEKWSRAKCPANRYNYMTSNKSGIMNVEKNMKFLNSTIKDTYEGIVYPVKDIPTWQTPNDLQVVFPPVIGNKLPGRPKNRDQIQSQGEGPILTRCGRCGAMGHSKTACNVPLPSVHKEKLTSLTPRDGKAGNPQAIDWILGNGTTINSSNDDQQLVMNDMIVFKAMRES
ncbi:transposase, MuDR, MULE transposase domain protein [Tanacetum coccineum]